MVGEMWGIVGKLGDAGRPCVQITTPAPAWLDIVMKGQKGRFVEVIGRPASK